MTIARFGSATEGRRRWTARPVLVSGLLALVLVLGLGQIALAAEASLTEREGRARLLSELNVIRATFESQLIQTIDLATGLRSYVEAYPDLDSADRIERLLMGIYTESRHLRNVALAPDNVITHVFPIAGNEAALGLVYEEIPDQWPAVERAMQTGRPVLDGPLELRQGGIGLINRTPAYRPDGSYWGAISLVVSIDSLMDDVDGLVADHPVDWALRSNGAGRREGGVVSGPAAMFDGADSVIRFDVSGQQWELAGLAGDLGRVQGRRLLFIVGGVAMAVLTAFLTMFAMAERQLARAQARQDPLTLLANRRQLEERLAELVGGGRRAADNFSLVFIDLDSFKQVNDTFGHSVGDALLAEIGLRLGQEMRDTDTIARVGGDEFVILLAGVRDQTGAEAAMDKLVGVLERPFEVNGTTVEIGASIGVGRFPDHGRTPDELLDAVDTAMYRAKRTLTDAPGSTVSRIHVFPADLLDREPGGNEGTSAKSR